MTVRLVGSLVRPSVTKPCRLVIAASGIEDFTDLDVTVGVAASAPAHYSDLSHRDGGIFTGMHQGSFRFDPVAETYTFSCRTPFGPFTGATPGNHAWVNLWAGPVEPSSGDVPLATVGPFTLLP